MRSITDHLKRIRKEAVQNDFITFAWLLYSILLIIFFVGIGYEAIFYLSSSIRLFILKTLLVLGLLIILFVFIINVLIEQNKIKRYSWSQLARSAGKLAFPKSDVVINAFQLEKSNSIIESNSLSNSYIDGISKKLNRLNLKKLFPTRLAEFWKVINLLILSLGIIMIVLFWNSTSNAMIRWGHPYHEFEVPKPFNIEGITRNIHLLGGESSPLNFKAFGQVPDSLYLELIPSSNDTSILYIMNKDSNGLYTYEVEEVYEDYRYRAYSPAEHFWQAWDKIITPYYYISVTDRPIMEEFTIKISPPDYSGLSISIQKANQSDVNALIGSSIRIDLKSNRKLKNGYLSLNEKKTPLKIKGKRAAGEFIFKEDALLKILLEDHRGITNQNPIPYHLQIIPDLKPEMNVIQPQPVLELGTEQLIPIQIKIEDDFGFSTLQIGYEIKRPSYIENQSQISIFPIYISDPKVLSQEIKSIWKLNEYNLMPEDEVHYHFELYDNDKVSGPKKSISNTYIAKLPSLGDLFASIEEKEDKMMDDLFMRSNEIDKIQDQLKNLKLEMLKSDKIDWAQKQQIEETLSKIQEETEALKNIAESLEAINQAAEKHELFSDELMLKFSELRELVNEILDPELMTDVDEIKKALDKMNIKDLMKAMENLSSNVDNVEQQLDRFLDIFKRIKAEQKLNETLQRLDKLVEQQEQTNDKIQELNSKSEKKLLEQLSFDEKRNSNEFSNIREIMEEAAKAMDEFDKESSQALEDLVRSRAANETESLMNQTIRQLQKNRKEMAKQKSTSALDNIKNIQSEMNEIKNQFEKNTTQEMTLKFQKIMKDLLELSKNQESLEKITRSIPRNSQRLGEMAGKQQFIQNQLTKIVSEIIELSKETFAVTPKIGQGMGMANNHMEEAKKRLAERNGRGAANNQKSAMEGLNSAILAVSQSMNQMQSTGSASGFEQFLKRMQQMSGQQQGINNESMQLALGQLSSSIKEGLMGRLLSQQQQVQKNLQQLMNESKKSGEGGLGDLQGISKEIEDVINDFQKRRYNQQTKERQQRILSRMLDSQKSMTQRGFKEERKAETANEIIYEGPSGLPLDYGQRRNLAMEALNQSLKAGYSRDYQTMIRRYFNSLSKIEQINTKIDSTINE
ncbi:MAG: DUF4175 family protein [Candidatus Neomarinimicrobiota bacterium]|nr:DUF4175 family protein [Candidatus Neomarinimicrobiota bacterium]